MRKRRVRWPRVVKAGERPVLTHLGVAHIQGVRELMGQAEALKITGVRPYLRLTGQQVRRPHQATLGARRIAQERVMRTPNPKAKCRPSSLFLARSSPAFSFGTWRSNGFEPSSELCFNPIDTPLCAYVA